MSSAAGRRGNNPAASRLGQAIDFVVNGIAFPKLPSFKKGTCPTLLKAIEAQKIKMFIENILFKTAGRVVTGSPQRNRAELVFTPDGNFLELWLQTDLRWDTAPQLMADLNANGQIIYSPTSALFLATNGTDGVRIQSQTSDPGILKLSIGMPGINGPFIGHRSNDAPDNSIYSWPNDGSTGQVLTTDGSGNLSWGAGGSGAPTDASYVVISATGDLSAERVLTAGSGISITDGGANSTVTIAATGGGMTSFDVDGDSGPAQTIGNGNTLLILGGTDLASVASATDTITLNHSVSGVTAATYGDAANVAQIAVNAQGHITSASEVAISVAGLLTKGEVLSAAGAQLALVTWSASGYTDRLTLKQGNNISMSDGGSGSIAIGCTTTSIGLAGTDSGTVGYMDFASSRYTIRLTGGVKYAGVPSFIVTGQASTSTVPPGSIECWDMPIYISANAAIIPTVSDGASGWNKIYGTGVDPNQFFIYGGTGISVTGGGGAGNTISIDAQNNGTVTSIQCANDGTFIDLSGGTITSTGTVRADLSATGTASSSTFLRGDGHTCGGQRP